MGCVIALAGKGGTGKTTTAALLVRILCEQKKGSVLAIDADPNSNLGEVLGVAVKESIGSILDDVSRHPDQVPANMSKDRYIEYRVQTTLSEADGFDLLTMGRPEGPGCYCYVNNVLRNVIARVISEYAFVVIDNEAGLEHFSRRTTRAADALVVVSDPSVVALRAAERISGLVDELEMKIKKKMLIINRAPALQAHDTWQQAGGLAYLGSVPVDEVLLRLSSEGKSIESLPCESVSLTALRQLGEKIWH